jgi:SAM-dependent methyltransferase
MLAHDNERVDPAVAAFLTASGIDPAGVDLAIDARDEMLAWALRAHHGSRQMALVSYFRSGLSAARLFLEVLRWRFGTGAGPRILDFASGYGRVTRFLATQLPTASLSVAEIDPDAVEFQRHRFGVGAHLSAHRAADLAIDDRFDCILVSSLFSHLPEAAFEEWLRHLLGLVAPGGLLAFSVHDEAVMLAGREMPTGGLYFEEVSESGSLDLRRYGSSWVRESFVAGALGRATDGLAAYRRLPLALWHSQDLYVAAPEPGPSLSFSGLAPVHEPEGYLDRYAVQPDGTLRLGGWALDRTAPGSPVRIELAAGRSKFTAETRDERPDVAALHGADYLRSGWSVVLGPADRFRADDLVVARAESVGGGAGGAVVHASALEVANLYAALARDRVTISRLESDLDRATAELRGVRVAIGHESARVAELDRRVYDLGWENKVLNTRLAAMRSSVFWKLRNAWFTVKGLVSRGARLEADGP